jgi:hypothetical protein
MKEEEQLGNSSWDQLKLKQTWGRQSLQLLLIIMIMAPTIFRQE